MKKIVLFLIITSIFCCNNEEHNPYIYKEFYETHKHDEDVMTLNMFPFIFKLFIDKSDKKTKQTVDEIETIGFLINENTSEKFKKDLDNHLPDKLYATILKVDDGNASIRFLSKETDEYVKELIMVVEEDNNCFIMNIEGSFNKEDIKNFSEKINVDDLVKYRI